MENKIKASWMLYGATGYTGTLIAEEAVRRGHRPVLAGRNSEKLLALATRLKLEWVAFSLEDSDALSKAVASVELLVHAAGCYAETCEKVMDACLMGMTHYLDISNEIFVLQAAQARHQIAKEKGISIIPGIGFGSIASNCLARYVCEQISDPVSLEIIISPYVSQKSAGAAKSTLETIARGSYVRRNKVLVKIPFGSGAKCLHIDKGSHNVLPVPTGDLEAAYLATGIADITIYMTTAINPILVRILMPLAQKLLSWDAFRQLVVGWIDNKSTPNIVQPVDPNRNSWLWARVSDRQGNETTVILETGEGYTFTASASIKAMEWVLAKQPIGAHSPASVFGANFVLQIEGARWHSNIPVQA